jgi:type II secretory pathway component PulF
MYWRYRAYNANEQMFSGVIKGKNVPIIALELRQKGLQIVEVTQIDYKSYVRENRSQQLQTRFNSEIHTEPIKKHKKSILSKLLNIFRN